MAPKNGTRVTNRDLLDAVQGVHSRIDVTHTRIDGLAKEQVDTNRQMTSLRGVVNDSIHAIEDRVSALEAPWKLVGRGRVWFIAGLGLASGAAALGTRLGIWPI